MIPKSGNRFSEKIMLNRYAEEDSDPKKSYPAQGLRAIHERQQP
jgi:hypothetical protein